MVRLAEGISLVTLKQLTDHFVFIFVELRNRTKKQLKDFMSGFLTGVQTGPLIFYYSGHGQGIFLQLNVLSLDRYIELNITHKT